jgi:hypothetical protein
MTPTAKGDPRITYNKHHIALGTSGYNFCWFHPRRAASYCHMHVKGGLRSVQRSSRFWRRPELKRVITVAAPFGSTSVGRTSKNIGL